MAGVPTINSTSHEAALLTCHDSSNCRASASRTGGRKLKTQVKAGRHPENFNTDPSPVRNMHFEGPQNMNQMISPFMEKEKFIHPFFKRS